MPSNYNFTQNGVVYSFDDVFVPGKYFRQNEEGGLWVWGTNVYGVGAGQLGINNTINKSTPVTTFSGGSDWKYISSLYDTSTAIKTDGSLWVWGANSSGQLGINNTINKSTPVTTFSGGNDWKQVSCGSNNIAAIKTDGSLWVWGANSSGQLGINNTISKSTPVTTFLGGNNWKQVSSGNDNTSAIKTDGSLWVWGSDFSASLGINGGGNKLTPVTTFAGGNNWQDILSGASYSVAIKTDGSLWVWGYNSSGQLGINNTITKSTPVTTFAGGNDWKLANCGQFYASAIKTDGSLWVWGSNSSGQLGINDTTQRDTPVTTFAGGNDWKISSGGNNHTAAIKTDGSLWVWGANSSGQLGINNTITKSTPVTTFSGGNDWKNVDAGRNYTLAIKYYIGQDPII